MNRAALLLSPLLAFALGASPAAAATERADDLVEQGTCDPDALLADVRAGMAKGSPALRRYLRALLVEAALVTPDEVLWRQFEREDDPAVLEALGAAIARKAETVDDPRLVAPLLKRALQDADPARRAASIAGLRETGSVELMAASGVDVDYTDLVRDPAQEVRAAVVENLVAEDDEVYSGHDARVAKKALEVAAATTDKEAAARLLSETSTETLGEDEMKSLARTLDDDDPALKRAAAKALGGLPPSVAQDASSALVAAYRRDDRLEVRREILASIARLERGRAAPTLTSLLPVDPRLSTEIHAWIAVLERGLPEWALVEREMNRP